MVADVTEIRNVILSLFEIMMRKITSKQEKIIIWRLCIDF